MDLQPNYMPHKIFDNGLVVKHKDKVTLTLNKPPYIGMCILELGKVLMYKLYYDYIKNKYSDNSRLLLTDTGSLMYKMYMKILATMKKCLALVITQLSQNPMILQTN